MKGGLAKFLIIFSVIMWQKNSAMLPLIEIELEEPTSPIGNQVRQMKQITHKEFIKFVDKLCGAAIEKDIELIKNIIRYYHANIIKKAINSGDEDNLTALHCAASTCCKEMIELLLSLGADKSIKDDDGKIPWDYAVEFGCNDEIKSLLSISSNLKN